MNPSEDASPTRRDFTAALAALAVAPLALAPESVRAEETDPVDALTELARARFGKNLSEEQLREVRRTIARDQRAGELLRRVKLHNGDEPSFVFRADLP